MPTVGEAKVSATEYGAAAAPVAPVVADPTLVPATLNSMLFPCTGEASRLLVRVALRFTDVPGEPEPLGAVRRVANPLGRLIRQMPRP